MDLDLVRIRLYIETATENPGLFYGKNRVRVCDNIWTTTINNWMTLAGDVPETAAWKIIYKNDKASPAEGFYSLDINKFAMLT